MATDSTRATLLFTDIEGSTRLLTTLGEQTYAEVLALHHRLMREALGSHDGVETATEGDSFFVVFDDARAAVRAAVGAQAALDSVVWPEGARVRVRMGVHTGPVARSGGNLVGLSIHTAARIMSSAHGGQIVISDECARAVGDHASFTLHDLGQHRLRDIEGPIRLWQVDRAGDDTVFPPLKSLPFGLAPVPAYLTALVGRDRERAALTRLLDEHRLVSVTGPPGVGKTRLAVEVARGRRDVGFADLAPLEDGDQVPARLAAALAVPVRPNESATEALLRELADASFLVLLDNCERVLDDVARLLSALMPQCPALHVLLTSREPLAIDGEVVWPLEPLAEASTLFVRRAQSLQAGLELHATDPTVMAICDQVDRLPLAVELAASLVRTMSPSEIVRHLDDRIGLLRAARRDLPERHRTLEAAIDWSFQLLGPEEQRCLARLSVMRGSFDLEAAEHVGGVSISVITRLCDRSLLVAEGTSGTTRYRLLDTIREYAARELTGRGDRAEAERAHATLFARRAVAVREQSSDRVSHLAAIDVDAHNYDVALAWFAQHDPVAALPFALDLEGLLTSRLDAAKSAALLESLLEAAGDAPAGTRGAALAILADVYRNSGRFRDARRRAEEAVNLGTSEHLNARVSPRVILGQITAMQGELDRAAELFEANLADAQAAGDDVEEMVTLRELANIEIERNRAKNALPLLEAAAARASRAEGPWLGGMLDRDRARVALALGDLAGARTGFEQSLALTQHYGIMRGVAGNMVALARVARQEGDLESPVGLLDEAARIYESWGDTGGVAHVLVERALLESANGRHARALELLGAAHAVRDELGIATPGSEVPGIESVRRAAQAALGVDEVDRRTAAGRTVQLGGSVRS